MGPRALSSRNGAGCLEDFSDRFVMGTDQHYPLTGAGPERWQADVLLLNQISAGARQKIAAENAVRIYHLR